MVFLVSVCKDNKPICCVKQTNKQRKKHPHFPQCVHYTPAMFLKRFSTQVNPKRRLQGLPKLTQGRLWSGWAGAEMQSGGLVCCRAEGGGRVLCILQGQSSQHSQLERTFSKKPLHKWSGRLDSVLTAHDDTETRAFLTHLLLLWKALLHAL